MTTYRSAPPARTFAVGGDSLTHSPGGSLARRRSSIASRSFDSLSRNFTAAETFETSRNCGPPTMMRSVSRMGSIDVGPKNDFHCGMVASAGPSSAAIG